MIDLMRLKLADDVKQDLLQDLDLLPGWMASITKKVCNDPDFAVWVEFSCLYWSHHGLLTAARELEIVSVQYEVSLIRIRDAASVDGSLVTLNAKHLDDFAENLTYFEWYRQEKLAD
jgi:hypothetical protein